MSLRALRRSLQLRRSFATIPRNPDPLQFAKAWRWRHFDNIEAAASSDAALPPSAPVQPEGHTRAKAAIAKLPGYTVSPMPKASQSLTELCGLGELWLKDESERFGVGSFKVLGGSLAVASAIAKSGPRASIATASAGNHGLGVAWACKVLGGGAVPCHVFLHSGVSEAMADRIRSLGATVHRVESALYTDALAGARRKSEAEGWTIVQDVSWDGYTEVPRQIFEGYTVLAQEMIEQWMAEGAQAPTHVLVNSGIGGLATGVCSQFWAHYGNKRPRIIAVEPLASDCLLRAARDGKGNVVQVPPSAESTIQVGLDVKCADPYTWPTLKLAINDFVAIGDEAVQPSIDILAREIPSPIIAGDSAVAGLGVLVAAAAQPAFRTALGLSKASRVAVIICEGVAK
eukprot:TRINITY_DN49226_c0_g1_i1.p1 TRINITY_DN49226_c0_g1~~TRINITY_DN49226_c0_g1_i1.p1  ORF type:complete len:401 (-),score=56.58 TRINITY_DN49226_c0_g1_i1:47-1249(-)